jgi:hypothetical protein
VPCLPLEIQEPNKSIEKLPTRSNLDSSHPYEYDGRNTTLNIKKGIACNPVI